jgi:hypothetical protein
MVRRPRHRDRRRAGFSIVAMNTEILKNEPINPETKVSCACYGSVGSWRTRPPIGNRFGVMTVHMRNVPLTWMLHQPPIR